VAERAIALILTVVKPTDATTFSNHGSAGRRGRLWRLLLTGVASEDPMMVALKCV